MVNAMKNNRVPRQAMVVPQNRGLSLIEVIVAFTLLTSVMTLSLPLVVRHGRLLSAQRDYRIALDEVSNQLERITALEPNKVPSALEQLTISSAVAEKLPAATLKGELTPADIGGRVTMRLTWAGVHGPAVTMSAWVFPPIERSNGEADEADAS